MVKYYCDRCGEEITKEHFNMLVLSKLPSKPNIGVDMDAYETKCLCACCTGEYRILMRGFMKNKIQVYKNPSTQNFECEGRYL
jgi:hypothetical protein